MSKNVNNVENEEGVEQVEVKEEKVSKKEVKKASKNKKEKKQSKIGKKAKETIGELKKVTWPTFPQVVKKTGVVLAVVLFFRVVLLGFDYVLKFMFKLLTNMKYTAVELWVTVGIVALIVILAVVGVVVWRAKKGKKESK